jgi:hypothetical protein
VQNVHSNPGTLITARAAAVVKFVIYVSLATRRSKVAGLRALRSRAGLGVACAPAKGECTRIGEW